ncbi:hypothetical protein N0V93_006327 [Gnomoniopsis smithogilvyi]|uniref:Uncharacterized protein n=1 Tax=Gnomoniopsis smithogilvyi TaxID=1191159 RepID=A0A9W9CVH4_9PEZI|nr:hypothetical protein N0V93_006327 [Gnomoniopsis smithogilvyi]
MESSGSSSIGSYSDGVYDKVEGQSQAAATNKPLPKLKPPVLPAVMLACLILLFTTCFIGILLSGLLFGHRVTSGDCLGQSWVMFSSILGLLYITLHLQAALKSEPVNRNQPPSENPLHASVIVVARLDTIAWLVSLIVVSVAVSKDPAPVSIVDLVACVAVIPVIIFILCVTEKATRPFDIPYLTNPSSASSTITCRVSDFMRAMPEVSVEDSISRRGSSHSTSSSSSRNGRVPRPNSHTQHAAAIAAANVGQTAGLSGPRPPPPTVKEARPWNFTSFDHRTKEELAASVTVAAQTSDARHHVGGPRALAVSEKAMQTGVLPPPVCFEPKVVQVPTAEDNREHERLSASRTPSQSSSGTWRKDWSNLAAETGYQSTPTTPASTPGIGSYGSFKAANRCLSPVVEESRRLSGAVQQASVPVENPVYRPRQMIPQSSPAPSTTTSSRTRCFATTPSSGSSSYTYSSTPPSSGYSYDSASIPRPPPPAATDPRAGMSPARVRLMRAQEALKVRGGAKDTVVMLKRPPRLTGDARPTRADPRTAVSSTPARPEYLRMPGSFEE